MSDLREAVIKAADAGFRAELKRGGDLVGQEDAAFVAAARVALESAKLNTHRMQSMFGEWEHAVPVRVIDQLIAQLADEGDAA